MTIEAKDVIRNAFLDDLGTDWVGVTANGTIIARAGSEEAVRKCGDPGEIVAAFSAADFLPEAATTEPDPEVAEPPPADSPPEDTAPPPAPAKKAAKKK